MEIKSGKCLKDEILEVCKKRSDGQIDQVRISLLGRLVTYLQLIFAITKAVRQNACPPKTS